ncbi:hypothetical protein [Flavobacterium sp. FlaQc-30]|uniref:hypothetical protein n=1 Tax=Flavobacterium sp. FlaQc-30 TaxID=3374179 RepID=UPI003756A5E4
MIKPIAIKTKKTLSIALLLALTASCRNISDTWLKEYQKTKCEWDKKEKEFKLDSIERTAGVNAELISVKNEIARLTIPIQYQIKELDSQISKTNIKYLKKNREISDRQEAAYGHISTPEFEMKLKENDDNNIGEVQILENKKKILQSKLNDNKTYQKLIFRQNQIKDKTLKITQKIQENYNIIFDGLKQKLDNQNSDYRMILLDLNNIEKQNFKNQRDQINKNPCK